MRGERLYLCCALWEERQVASSVCIRLDHHSRTRRQPAGEFLAAFWFPGGLHYTAARASFCSARASLANGSLLPSASYRLMRPILLPCNKRRRALFSLFLCDFWLPARERDALFLLSQFGLTRNSLLVSMGRKRPPASLVSELAQQRFGRRGIFEKQFLFQHKVFKNISNCLFFLKNFCFLLTCWPFGASGFGIVG